MVNTAKRVSYDWRGTAATARALKRIFDEAHAEGMTALQRKDYAALAVAVRQEQQVIEAHRVLIGEQRASGCGSMFLAAMTPNR